MGQMAEYMEAMANGLARPLFAVSSLDPGVGKTTTLIQFLRVLMRSQLHTGVGALICVSRLAEIEKMVEDCGLTPDQFAVFTSDDEINGLGRPDRANARVLFTTHQMVLKRVDGRDFKDVEELLYLGKPRSLRVWDEAILPGEALTLDRDGLAALFRYLRGPFPQLVSRLEELFESLSTMKDGDRVSIPDLQETYGIDLNQLLGLMQEATATDIRVATTLWRLGGKVASVRQDGQGRKTMLDYRDILPDDLTPLLVLDASGRVRGTYTAWKEGRRNLRLLKAAPKSYRNLTTHVWNTSGGKSAFRTNSETLVSGIAATINSTPHEKFLVVHHKSGLGFDLPERLIDYVGGDRGRVRFIHWGSHNATNEFCSIPNVILAGTLFYRPSLYEAYGRMSSGTPSGDHYPEAQYNDIRLGEHADLILQAACRGAIRLCEGDSCPTTHLYIIASVQSGIRAALPNIFPGTRVVDWCPVQTVLKGRVREAVAYIEYRLDDPTCDVVKFSEVRSALGMTCSSNFRTDIRQHDQFSQALAEKGIVEWGTGSRKTAFRRLAEIHGFKDETLGSAV